MKILLLAAFLLVLALLLLAGYGIYRGYRKAVEGRVQWQIEREETIDATEFWLVRKGEAASFIGRAHRGKSDYSDKLIELQSAAEEQRDEWNATERVLSR